ncbi:glycosyltransferase family 4 protein [Longispora sp. NPDC051575]|uniref:glycosyltransferase family 4 protein n=1 Tax=Longispora sp. NPDC051575 TaxID=3154943 RepID=UPI00343011B6
MPLGVREVVAVLSRARCARSDVAARTAISRWATTRAVAEQLSRVSPLDAVVVMGTELYDVGRVIPERIPWVTFDDATVVQQNRDPGSDVRQARVPAGILARSTSYERAAARSAALCCVTTQWAGRSVVEDYGVPAEKVVVVGMGHRPRIAGEDRDWSAPRYLFVGADWERKNGAAVLRAFERVRARVPAASLDLVGNHPPVNTPGVTTHGFLTREDTAAQVLLDRLYATATCFVLPSLYDAAGIAYLEAASSGLPVVATTRGGAPEVLGDGALAVDPHDRAALFEAMLTLSDPATARTMGERARHKASTSSWWHVAGRVLEALENRQRTAGSVTS